MLVWCYPPQTQLNTHAGAQTKNMHKTKNRGKVELSSTQIVFNVSTLASVVIHAQNIPWLCTSILARAALSTFAFRPVLGGIPQEGKPGPASSTQRPQEGCGGGLWRIPENTTAVGGR